MSGTRRTGSEDTQRARPSLCSPSKRRRFSRNTEDVGEAASTLLRGREQAPPHPQMQRDRALPWGRGAGASGSGGSTHRPHGSAHPTGAQTHGVLLRGYLPRLTWGNSPLHPSCAQAGTFLLLRPGVTVPVKITFLKFKMKS